MSYTNDIMGGEFSLILARNFRVYTTKKFLQFDWLRAVVFQLNAFSLYGFLTKLFSIIV